MHSLYRKVFVQDRPDWWNGWLQKLHNHKLTFKLDITMTEKTNVFRKNWMLCCGEGWQVTSDQCYYREYLLIVMNTRGRGTWTGAAAGVSPPHLITIQQCQHYWCLLATLRIWIKLIFAHFSPSLLLRWYNYLKYELHSLISGLKGLQSSRDKK